MSKELLEAVKRLASDEEYRAGFMTDPRTRLSELGVPAEVVDRIVPTLLAALAAGPIVLNELGPNGIDSEFLGWR